MRIDEEIGVSYRQIDWWMRQGYLNVTGNGSGTMRNFTNVEKEVARLMGRLVRVGFAPKSAAGIARVAVEEHASTLDLGDNIELQIGSPATV